jgi:hypothetical protein
MGKGQLLVLQFHPSHMRIFKEIREFYDTVAIGQPFYGWYRVKATSPARFQRAYSSGFSQPLDHWWLKPEREGP